MPIKQECGTTGFQVNIGEFGVLYKSGFFDEERVHISRAADYRGNID